MFNRSRANPTPFREFLFRLELSISRVCCSIGHTTDISTVHGEFAYLRE